jgi:hypothetical protein
MPGDCRRFCAEKASDFNKSQQVSTADRNKFNINQLEATNFNRLH